MEIELNKNPNNTCTLDQLNNPNNIFSETWLGEDGVNHEQKLPSYDDFTKKYVLWSPLCLNHLQT